MLKYKLCIYMHFYNRVIFYRCKPVWMYWGFTQKLTMKINKSIHFDLSEEEKGLVQIMALI